MKTNKITKQEAFNNVWQHFVVEENPPSMREDGFCLYKSENGNGCAIGIMIPDEVYEPLMDSGGDAGWLMGFYPKVQDLFDFDRVFALRLQETHDHSTRFGSFHAGIKDRLESLALSEDLEIPEVE